MQKSAPGPHPVARYGWEPSYAGVQTFLKLPLCLSPDDLVAGAVDVAVGGIPWDGTNTARAGTHLGPSGIRRADNAWSPPLGRPSQKVRIDPFDHLVMADCGDAQVVPGSAELTGHNIERFVREILGAGCLPLLLGGDCWTNWPVISAVAQHYGPGTVGVVHFDAHPDCAKPEPGTVGNHGTAIRQLVDSGAVPGDNVIQVGVRGNWPSPAETEWMEQQGLRTHYMMEIENRGFRAVLDDVIAEASAIQRVFVWFDIDCVDPAFAPGTGSAEPGGLTSGEALRAMRRLAHEVGVAGMNVTEVSPPYDVGNNITALLANRLVLETMTGTAMRKAGISGVDYAHPRAAGGPPSL